MGIWHDKMDFRNMLWDFIEPLTVADLVGSIGMSEERAQEVMNSQELDADMSVDEAKDMLREIVGQRSAEELASISGMEEDDMQMLIDLVSGTRKLSNTMTTRIAAKNTFKIDHVEQIRPETYRFEVTIDKGARLFITVYPEPLPMRIVSSDGLDWLSSDLTEKQVKMLYNEIKKMSKKISARIKNVAKVLAEVTKETFTAGQIKAMREGMADISYGEDNVTYWLNDAPVDRVVEEYFKNYRNAPKVASKDVRTAAEVTHELRVCGECLLFIANGDLPEDPEREEEIIAGVESFAPGHVVAGDSDNDDEFSRRPCECCGTTLAGSRHDAVVIG